MFQVHIEEDQPDVHLQHLCNAKIMQYTKDESITSRMTLMTRESHSSCQCPICELFQLRGRPKKNRPLQKNRQTL